jgi:hypothetical protein
MSPGPNNGADSDGVLIEGNSVAASAYVSLDWH